MRPDLAFAGRQDWCAKTMKRVVLSTMTALALLGGMAEARTAQEADRPDHVVFNDVAREVRRYVHYTIFDDVNASVESGTVTLTGAVTMPYKKDDIGKRVARVAGVRTVRNLITVLPVSNFDDGLRYRAARAIYGNPNFWNYAAMANPPIHIVVDRGRITLSGVVFSDVDRMLARSAASSLGAFSVTNALKTDAEVKEQLERID
jgi:hyperosmotically inducible protein